MSMLLILLNWYIRPIRHNIYMLPTLYLIAPMKINGSYVKHRFSARSKHRSAIRSPTSVMVKRVLITTQKFRTRAQLMISVTTDVFLGERLYLKCQNLVLLVLPFGPHP